MRDLIFIAVTLAFFLAVAAYTLLCEKIVGPDDADGQQSVTGVTVVTDDHDRVTVA